MVSERGPRSVAACATAGVAAYDNAAGCCTIRSKSGRRPGDDAVDRTDLHDLAEGELCSLIPAGRDANRGYKRTVTACGGGCKAR